MVCLGNLLEDPGDLLDSDLGTRMDGLVVLVVTDVLVSPSSVVTEFCDGVSLDSDWEFVEPQSPSFSQKRSFVFADSQEEMRYGSPVEAPPPSRRRMMPSTPQQSSYPSIEEMQRQTEMEDQGSGSHEKGGGYHRWTAPDRAVSERKHLNKSN